MDKIQLTMQFEKLVSSLGFLYDEKDDYSIKYKKRDVKLQLFFGRYSEKPDIFIRFQDEAIPEQFSVSSMMFIDELSQGTNTQNEMGGEERLIHLLNYFAQDTNLLLKKDICRKRKKDIETYLAENF
jgi:hypothetical protein